MSAHGTAAEYVYSELQVVSSVGCPANDPMVGRHVVSVRLNLGPEDPSRVFILDMSAATQLRADLDRVLDEHRRILATPDHESTPDDDDTDDTDTGEDADDGDPFPDLGGLGPGGDEGGAD